MRQDAHREGGRQLAGEEDRGAARAKDSKSYFLNVKGPELLNKYVGETERHIRLIFARAREKAGEGTPVVVFFDEMDSLFRTRGSGVSSDVETTIVPQLLSELDGVERLENVIVIGASNREDMIDPAMLRPGRLDVKIKIQRPDAEAARDIFAKYLTPDLPLHPDDLHENGGSPEVAVAAMIDRTVERMYTETEENQFLEVTYANGDKEILYFKDFNSGAMIQNIVDRAKKMAIKDLLETGQKGIRIDHLLDCRASTSSRRTRTSRTRRTPTTGPGSPARRASASSTSGRSSRASRAPSRAAPSTRSRTPASTCRSCRALKVRREGAGGHRDRRRPSSSARRSACTRSRALHPLSASVGPASSPQPVQLPTTGARQPGGRRRRVRPGGRRRRASVSNARVSGTNGDAGSASAAATASGASHHASATSPSSNRTSPSHVVR